jgi:hypothetical protein
MTVDEDGRVNTSENLDAIGESAEPWRLLLDAVDE